MNIKTLIKGGKKYAEAVALGDRADKKTREHRVQTCLECEALGAQTAPKFAGCSWSTCGNFAEETRSTCGCIVALSVSGHTIPAGKTRVGSERCPRGKW